MLPQAIAVQRFEAVSGRRAQEFERSGGVEHRQFALGLTPDRESSVRVVGDPPLLLLGEESLSLETVLKIGRLDPVPAPSFDDSHLLGQLTPKERDWISGLTRGELITLN